ncbi:Histidine phosphatase superfamily clade-2 [Macrophomina phaseolina MS6]|uniref:Histidine phosphatase superfamily clade-2 n=1 Tax=Macrophomina phaseolina (strain MS6) TaxID=1126212 RepID=K2RWT7_MACPH|nr:Histidine phosphatase superfamily clade-2 [Macrophomina phaseolina MS6]
MALRATDILAALWLASTPLVVSATVHAAVIFTRTGERTPLLGEVGPPELTPLGATQAYSQGSLFRQRYISPQTNNIDLRGPDAISNISEHGLINSQVYILTSDDSYTAATAQAFLQGLYPPYTLNDTAAPALTAAAVLANGSYIEAPLNGYQYPRIRTVSRLDPFRVYIAGQEECLDYAVDRTSYFYSTEFNETQARTRSLYAEVGAATLTDVLPEASYSYVNAYAIYDYLSYQYVHDTSIQAILSNNSTLEGAFDELRFLADQQQWALNSVPNPSQWIRAIAGKMLARKVLGQLAVNIASQGTVSKLSLLFGEFQPILSFFSLAFSSRANSSTFRGIPNFASSMVFELFSYGDSMDSYPSISDLWVRFYFRNGTSNSSELVTYPLFGHGPSDTAMSWSGFEASMSSIMLDDVSDWCAACGASTIFCPALNSSLGVTERVRSLAMRPAAAGAIGAGVTLGIGFLVMGLMLLGGLRFHRIESVIGAGTRRKSSLGGFKGRAKLASDADVSFASKGASFGVSVAEHRRAPESDLPRERIGSWELGDAKRDLSGGNKDLKGDESRRSSLDICEDTMSRPTMPHERV